MKIMFVHWGREHLGIEYLSSYLQHRGHQVSLAIDPAIFTTEDNVFYNKFLGQLFAKKKRILENVQKTQPQIVAFSCYTSTIKWALEMAAQIKQITPSIYTVFGGIHCTLLPHQVIKHESVDFVIVGEGEKPLALLADAIQNNSDFAQIPNLLYRKESNIIETPLSKELISLDELPFPDKNLFARDVQLGNDYLIMTNRGCPFSCNYCCEQFLSKYYDGKYFRRRSVDSVIRELAEMKTRYDIKRIMFFDSILFTNREWVQEFIYRYQKEISLPFRCTGHVSFSSDETICSLKKAGCYNIDFGVQTFNAHVRNKILNRHESNEIIHKALSVCEANQLSFDVDIMLGLPTETVNDYKLVIHNLAKYKYLNRIKCFNLNYFPCLPITEIAIKNGNLSPQTADKIKEGDITTWFHNSSISNPKMLFEKKCFEKFYKLYSLLPKPLCQVLLKHRLYYSFYLLPSLLIKFLQFLIGIKKGDPRFGIYLKNYLRQIKKPL